MPRSFILLTLSGLFIKEQNRATKERQVLYELKTLHSIKRQGGGADPALQIKWVKDIPHQWAHPESEDGRMSTEPQKKSTIELWSEVRARTKYVNGVLADITGCGRIEQDDQYIRIVNGEIEIEYASREGYEFWKSISHSSFIFDVHNQIRLKEDIIIPQMIFEGV